MSQSSKASANISVRLPPPDQNLVEDNKSFRDIVSLKSGCIANSVDDTALFLASFVFE